MRSDLALQPGEMWTAKCDGEGGSLVVVAAHISQHDLEVGAPVLTLFLIDPQRQTRDGKDAWARLFKLTASESEVASLMLRGLSRREIADARGVSEGTVHTQMRALYAKLHVSKLNDAVLLLSATSGG
jgi:DNA-binding NarL/FixJ family response regulator